MNIDERLAQECFIPSFVAEGIHNLGWELTPFAQRGIFMLFVLHLIRHDTSVFAVSIKWPPYKVISYTISHRHRGLNSNFYLIRTNVFRFFYFTEKINQLIVWYWMSCTSTWCIYETMKMSFLVLVCICKFFWIFKNVIITCSKKLHISLNEHYMYLKNSVPLLKMFFCRFSILNV